MARRGLLFLAAWLAFGTVAGARSPDPADLVLRGAAVYTVDGARSWAEAVAVSKGRIVFVGANASASPWIGRSTKVMDLPGKMVLPAFHDAHVHPVSGGVEALECNLNGLRTKEAILEKVKRYAAEHPKAKWIQGGGWDLTVFPDGNPSKALLDAIVPDRPVYLPASDGHSVWVNSKALKLAGVTKATPDPPYGRIERDTNGRAERDAAGGRGGSGREAHSGAEREGACRRTRRRAADREQFRPDLARRGERLGGGSRGVRRARRAGKADRPRAGVALRGHGQGHGGGAEARGAAFEIRPGPRAHERREDLRRRRARDAHGVGPRALRRFPRRSGQAQPAARGFPDPRHGAGQGGVPDPRPRDRRPGDPGHVRRVRGRAAGERSARRAAPHRPHRAVRSRPTSRASASSASSRTSSRSGRTPTSTSPSSPSPSSGPSARAGSTRSAASSLRAARSPSGATGACRR